MNNIDDILAKLRAGATEEDIASELSKNLNAAVKKLAEEKANLAPDSRNDGALRASN